MGTQFGVLLMTCGIIMCSAEALWAKVVVLPINKHDVTVHHADEDSVRALYVFKPALPNALKYRRIDRATLEFYVDVDAAAYESIRSVQIEVHPLSSAFRDGRPVEFVPSRAIRSVLIGSSRVVRLDVTPVVRNWVSAPLSNHGLVLGALTGDKEGRFLLRDDRLSGGNMARLVIRYGPEVRHGKDIEP